MSFISIIDASTDLGIKTAVIQNKDSNLDLLSSAWSLILLRSIILYVILLFFSGNIANFYENQDIELIIKVLALRTIFQALVNPYQIYEIKATKNLHGLTLGVCTDENTNGSGIIDRNKRSILLAADVDALIADPNAVSMNGVSREMTIFFADLAGFTTLTIRNLHPAASSATPKLNPQLHQLYELHQSYEGNATPPTLAAPLTSSSRGSRRLRRR